MKSIVQFNLNGRSVSLDTDDDRNAAGLVPISVMHKIRMR